MRWSNFKVRNLWVPCDGWRGHPVPSKPETKKAGRATLAQAVAQGYTDAAALKQEPAFAPLRARPDFQKLLSKLDGKSP